MYYPVFGQFNNEYRYNIWVLVFICVYFWKPITAMGFIKKSRKSISVTIITYSWMTAYYLYIENNGSECKWWIIVWKLKDMIKILNVVKINEHVLL